MQQLTLKPREELRLLAGHPWVYANELRRVRPEPSNGDVVAVTSSRGQRVGAGFYSAQSKIAVRLMVWGDLAFEEPLVEQRLDQAVALRRSLVHDTEMLRWVHSESDGLPGLIVDGYGDALVLQVSSVGIEQRLERVVARLRELLAPASVVLLRSSPHRRKEGLLLGPPLALHGELPERRALAEGDLRYWVDVAAGPKGGFFVDQRDNRARLREFVRPGDRVLDLFSGGGGFGFSAARAGAGEVTLVDSGKETLERAEQSAALNELEVRTERADIVRTLASWVGEREPWDVVICDPPGMARSRSVLGRARRAYVKLSESAMGLVRPGGLLVSCSCSQAMDRHTFSQVLGEAARRAGRWARTLEVRGAGPDHPVLPGMPETEYLKTFYLRVD